MFLSIGVGIIAFVSLLTVFIFVNSQNMVTVETINQQKDVTINSGNIQSAYFAGGCFWCMEGIFESQSGVQEAIVGYAGGTEETAFYEQVGAGITEHREAVKVLYDPKIISYETLVELYFTQIDPTQALGQFADRGYQYTTAIYVQNREERTIATHFIDTLTSTKKFDAPIAVKIEDFTTFFRAEEYHQDYYKKSSLKYSLYKKGSGREDYIERTWEKELEKLTKNDLSSRLTPLQYQVTQEKATEQPFANEYWDNKRAGIYVDIVDGTPLYSSLDKYDSGTGWPSFTKPIDPNNVTFREDKKLWSTRIEVRSKYANSHLGHVFDDGPIEQGGKRYCMNSAALRFIPLEDLEKEGYGEWKSLFDNSIVGKN